MDSPADFRNSKNSPQLTVNLYKFGPGTNSKSGVHLISYL